jgi:hypothetical protein
MTLLEVVIATVLTLALVTMIVRWSGVLQTIASTSAARSDAQRTAALISAKLGADIESATGCDNLRRDHPVGFVSKDRLVLFSDQTLDGVPDRVTWFIDGRVLSRLVEIANGECSFDSTLSSGPVADTIDTSSASSFSVVAAGSIDSLSAPLNCSQDPSSCDFTYLRLTAVLVGGDGSSLVYRDSFSVTSAARFIGGRPSSNAVTLSNPGTPDAPDAAPLGSSALVTIAPPLDDGGSPINSYTVEVLSSSGTSPSGVTGLTTRTTRSLSFVFDGLTDGVSYTFRVSATNSIGSSPFSVASLPVTPSPSSAVPDRFSLSTGSTTDDEVLDLTVAQDGDVVVVGYISGQAMLCNAKRTPTGLSDLFIAKFSPSGSCRWSLLLSSSSSTSSASVADAGGPIVVAGTFAGTLTVSGASIPSVTSAGSTDGFVLAISRTGTPLSLSRLGSSSADTIESVAASDSKSIYVAGSFSGTLALDAGSVTSSGSSDAMLVKMSYSGAPSWVIRAGSSGTDKGTSVAVNSDGVWALAGSFETSIRFGSNTIASAGSTDGFLATGSSSGVSSTLMRFGGTGADSVDSVSSRGSLFAVAGSFSDTVRVGDYLYVSAGSTDVFVALLSAGFNSASMSGQIGSTLADEPGEVSINSNNRPVVSLSFQGTASLSPLTVTSLGARDVGVARLDSQDTFDLVTRAGGTGEDYARTIALSQDTPYLGGSISGSSSLGSSSYTSVGALDWFLAKLTSSLVW